MTSTLTKNQKIKTGWRIIGEKLRMQVEIRHDDCCGNGHNSFAITATIEEKRGNQWRDHSGGCLHDEIAKHFPEYSHLIKWHLFDTDNGPMHYIANTLFHASDRDCWGRRKGDPSNFEKYLKFENFPMTFKIGGKLAAYIDGLGKDDIQNLVIESIPHVNRKGDNYQFKPKFTFQGFADQWHYCPFDTLKEAEEIRAALQQCNFEIVTVATSFSEGKERDLDAARSCAAWPEATDDDLLSENLKEKLLERQSDLLSKFRADVESLGFVY